MVQYISELFITVGKYLSIMGPEVSGHGYLAPLLWAFGEAGHHGRKHAVEQNCNSHSGQEADRDGARVQTSLALQHFPSSSLVFYYYYFLMWKVFCLCICAPHAWRACRGQKRALEPWNWRYRLLWASLSMLRIKAGRPEQQVLLLGYLSSQFGFY